MRWSGSVGPKKCYMRKVFFVGIPCLYMEYVQKIKAQVFLFLFYGVFSFSFFFFSSIYGLNFFFFPAAFAKRAACVIGGPELIFKIGDKTPHGVNVVNFNSSSNSPFALCKNYPSMARYHRVKRENERCDRYTAHDRCTPQTLYAVCASAACRAEFFCGAHLEQEFQRDAAATWIQAVKMEIQIVGAIAGN